MNVIMKVLSLVFLVSIMLIPIPSGFSNNVDHISSGTGYIPPVPNGINSTNVAGGSIRSADTVSGIHNNSFGIVIDETNRGTGTGGVASPLQIAGNLRCFNFTLSGGDVNYSDLNFVEWNISYQNSTVRTINVSYTSRTKGQLMLQVPYVEQSGNTTIIHSNPDNMSAPLDWAVPTNHSQGNIFAGIHLNKTEEMKVCAVAHVGLNGDIVSNASAPLNISVVPPMIDVLSLDPYLPQTNSLPNPPVIHINVLSGSTVTFYVLFAHSLDSGCQYSTSIISPVITGASDFNINTEHFGNFDGFGYEAFPVQFTAAATYYVGFSQCIAYGTVNQIYASQTISNTQLTRVAPSDNQDYQVREATVNSDPMPSVSISSSANAADVGNPVNFTAHASGGSCTYEYNYTMYDGETTSSPVLLSGTSSSFIYRFSGIGSYLVTWKVESVGVTVNSSIIESINSDPTISVSENKTVTDVGNPIAFSSSSSGGTSPYYYTWYDRLANSSCYSILSTSQNPIYKFLSSGSYFVILSTRDASGYVVNSSLISIDVYPQLTGNISLSPSVLPLPNQTVEGQVILSGGSGVSQQNIVWTEGFSDMSGSFVQSQSWSIGCHLIEAVVTDNSGSILTLQAHLKVYPNSIRVEPKVVRDVPEHTPISLSANAYSFVGPNVTISGYIWNIQGSLISGRNISYEVGNPGIYQITITAWGYIGLSNDSNTTEVNVSVIASSTTPNIVINSGESSITGGFVFTFWVSFYNGSSYSAAFISLAGTTYQPSNISERSNGTVFISKHVYFSSLQAGHYSISIEVYDNQSQNRNASESFAVPLDGSATVSIYTIASFFGGYYNLLIFVATVASLGIAYAGIRTGKSPPVINIKENGKQVKYQLTGKRIGKR